MRMIFKGKKIWKKACVLLRVGAYIHFSYILFIQTIQKHRFIAAHR